MKEAWLPGIMNKLGLEPQHFFAAFICNFNYLVIYKEALY